MRESTIERKVVAYCREQGMLCYKFTSPARRGVPDRLILYRSTVFFLELKATGAKPTKLQLSEMKKLRDAGFRVEWTDNSHSACLFINAFKLGVELHEV